MTTPSPDQDAESALPLALRLSLIAVLVLFVALRVVEPLRDPDSFWHIAAGDRLADTWDFVAGDPWSASSTEPWILNQWLPELAMGATFRAGGYAAVVWLFSVASVGLLLCVWFTCRARASMLTSAVVTMAAFYALSGSLSPRPQLVSFALAAVTTHAWLRTVDDRRPRWWLLPMTWLWACSHGMWFLSGVIGVAAVLGMAVGRGSRMRELAGPGLVALGCVAVGALTPIGPRLLTSPFQVHGVTQFITEWQPPAPSDPQLLVTLALTGLAAWGAFRTQPWSRRWPRLLLCAVAVGLAVTYLRTIGLAAVIVAPMAAVALHDLSRLRRELSGRREPAVAAVSVAVAVLLSGLLSNAQAAVSGLGPEGTSPSLSAAPAGSVVCNDLLYGGWLILEHPELRPTMDSRFEIYSVAHIIAYRDFISGGLGWRRYLSDTGCTIALLAPESPVPALMASVGWTVVTAQNGVKVLTRP